MRIDFYDFIHRLLDKKDAVISVEFYNRRSDIYRDKVWIKRVEGCRDIVYGYSKLGPMMNTWHFRNKDWYVDSMQGPGFMESGTVHIRLSHRSDR